MEEQTIIFVAVLAAVAVVFIAREFGIRRIIEQNARNISPEVLAVVANMFNQGVNVGVARLSDYVESTPNTHDDAALEILVKQLIDMGFKIEPPAEDAKG